MNDPSDRGPAGAAGRPASRRGRRPAAGPPGGYRQLTSSGRDQLATREAPCATNFTAQHEAPCTSTAFPARSPERGDRMLRAPGSPHTALTQRRSAQVNAVHFRSILFTANGGHHGGRHDRPAAGRHWRARAVIQPARRRGKRPPRAHPRACRRGGPRAYEGLARKATDHTSTAASCPAEPPRHSTRNKVVSSVVTPPRASARAWERPRTISWTPSPT